MIDREPPNAAETRGASARARFCETSGLVRALGALPIVLERRIVGFQKLAPGESRFLPTPPLALYARQGGAVTPPRCGALLVGGAFTLST